jgi:hypothetical protein
MKTSDVRASRTGLETREGAAHGHGSFQRLSRRAGSGRRARNKNLKKREVALKKLS